MSIPIILASLVFEVVEYAVAGQAISIAWHEIIVGFLVAFVVGVLAVKFMLKIIERHSLIPFAVYLVVVSILSFFVLI